MGSCSSGVSAELRIVRDPLPHSLPLRAGDTQAVAQTKKR